MEEFDRKLLSIFNPYYLNRAQGVEKENIKFVQYTSAESAMNIIKNGEVWLMNARCMSDYSEVEHGLDCLINAFKNEKNGKLFKDTLDGIFPGITKEFNNLFDSWIPSFRNSTYMVCVSEHLPEEDQYGRLSMWRAYGGIYPVAIVLNKKPFLTQTDVFQAYANPVLYQDHDKFNEEFGNLAMRVNKEKEFIVQLGKNTVIECLFTLFKNTVLCVKHPGFKEEREWRVVYNPEIATSEHVTYGIESINGIPQEVYKIPLKDIPEGNFYGAAIPHFIEKIIIGPNDHQTVLGKTFSNLLKEAGTEDALEKIHYSGIPVR